jgi:hypothetical protein
VVDVTQYSIVCATVWCSPARARLTPHGPLPAPLLLAFFGWLAVVTLLLLLLGGLRWCCAWVFDAVAALLLPGPVVQ